MNHYILKEIRLDLKNVLTNFDVYQNFKKMLPKWGDKHKSNENDAFFSNACTVDNWLALVYIIANSRPRLFSGISTNTLVKVVTYGNPRFSSKL